MQRDLNPDRLDDGARADAEMKEREAIGPELREHLNKLRLTAFRTNAQADREAYCAALSKAFQNDELVPAALPAPQGDDGLVSGGVYECEDCVGMKDHGCFCLAMGASRPGGDEAADTVTDEMVTAFAIGAQMGDGNFTSSEPSIQRALDSSKARIKTGLEAALRSQAAEIAELKAGVYALDDDRTDNLARALTAESRLTSAMEALEPFAKHGQTTADYVEIRADDLRRARATLSRLKQGEKGGE